ncbi:uncharacterized protein HD556DRAFT_1050421 [Suillus plorans]|uniref:superoxide dismutase n=1 Tax=Suillus plorans TaxID=116603 RepID=A0A9P7DBC4_9AGAM|nr:uncharacterized protein HD556DRAFT_1050421 [Suillus plorans]KAG1786446.1 hypothetical protein HD556DRAFT_1050421 [Suillus plorans]
MYTKQESTTLLKEFSAHFSQGNGNGSSLKVGLPKKVIEQAFGSLDALKEFNATTAGIQGWGWLGLNLSIKHLYITKTVNQNPLLIYIPVDIREHAFYL